MLARTLITGITTLFVLVALLGQLRDDLAAAGFNDAQVLEFGAETDVLVRLPPQDGAEPNAIRAQLQAVLASGAVLGRHARDRQFRFRRTPN